MQVDKGRAGGRRADGRYGLLADGRYGQVAGAAAVLLVGVAAIVGATDLGYWRRGPGPGFFPLWLGVLLSVLAVVWAVQTYRSPGNPPREAPAPGGRRRVLLLLAGLAVLVALLDVLGYQLGMSLFVLYVLRVVTRRRLVEAVIAALVGGFGVYALFANVLEVYLPTASVGFLAWLGL